jgi:Tol biopolymer transport system component
MRALRASVWAIAVVLCTAAGAVGAASAAASPGLAYTTGGARGNPYVWTANANGGGRKQLGQGIFPVISPNGRQVAATVGFGNGSALAIYSTSGGATHKYFNASKAGVVADTWSPDSRYLAVALFDAGSSGVGNSALEIIDTQTGTATKVLTGIVQGVSFKPGNSDELVYALSASSKFSSKTNLFTVAAAGGTPSQLTHDGHSYFPVWGKLGIAFDEVVSVKNKAPAYSISLLNNGHTTSITHQKVTLLQDGLRPMAVSNDGRTLLASFDGEDTESGYVVDLKTHKTKELIIQHQTVTAYGISQDGTRALVDFGGFEAPPSQGTVESLPLAGGAPKILVRHASEASWNK